MPIDPRKKVWELAPVDVNSALEHANKVQMDWYKVQSLAMVARYMRPKARFLKIIKDALKIAQGIKEPNRIVSCSAWVVRSLTERSGFDPMPVVKELLEVIAGEPHPLRRADALFLLFQAAYSNYGVREIVLVPLLETCNQMHSWKRSVILSELVLVLALDDPSRAQIAFEMIKDDRTKRKTKKRIKEGKGIGPRKFFR